MLGCTSSEFGLGDGKNIVGGAGCSLGVASGRGVAAGDSEPWSDPEMALEGKSPLAELDGEVGEAPRWKTGELGVAGVSGKENSSVADE